MTTTEDRQENQVYEIGYLILPSIPEDKLSDSVNSIEEVIKKYGGEKFDSEVPFRHDLAYPIAKTVGASKYVVNDAYIGWIKFDLPAEALAKEGAEHPVQLMKAELDKIDELLRYLLIKAPKETKFRFADVMKMAEAETEGEVEEVKADIDTTSEAPAAEPVTTEEEGVE